MAHCADCGTKMSDGLCPNCHEEAFILETQDEFLPDEMSTRFLDQAEQQRMHAALWRSVKVVK